MMYEYSMFGIMYAYWGVYQIWIDYILKLLNRVLGHACFKE